MVDSVLEAMYYLSRVTLRSFRHEAEEDLEKAKKRLVEACVLVGNDRDRIGLAREAFQEIPSWYRRYWGYIFEKEMLPTQSMESFEETLRGLGDKKLDPWETCETIVTALSRFVVGTPGEESYPGLVEYARRIGELAKTRVAEGPTRLGVTTYRKWAAQLGREDSEERRGIEEEDTRIYEKELVKVGEAK